VGGSAFAALFFLLTVVEPAVSRADSVKFAGLVGLYVGWLSWTALAVAVVAAIVLSGLTVFLEIGKVRDGRRIVPLGPAMLVAALVALFVSPSLENWYHVLMAVRLR
jgi:leader peptidase (prepilin peptidase) / N-methyltransferase